MLPAFDSNNRLIFPQDSIKGFEYKCPQCKEKLFVRAGTKNRKHFAHRKNSECLFTGNGESTTHLSAKLLFIEKLQQGEVINFTRCCIQCNKTTPKSIKLESDETIHPEYTLIYEGRTIRPDIVILKGKMTSKIIEIFHTHRQQNRPEPWYEFHSQDILERKNDYIECREIKCDVCSPPLPQGMAFSCSRCRSPTISSLLNSEMVCLTCRIKSNRK